jgi:hypothetical protein
MVKEGRDAMEEEGSEGFGIDVASIHSLLSSPASFSEVTRMLKVLRAFLSAFPIEQHSSFSCRFHRWRFNSSSNLELLGTFACVLHQHLPSLAQVLLVKTDAFACRDLKIGGIVIRSTYYSLLKKKGGLDLEKGKAERRPTIATSG